jgi:hypothetical protein
MCVSNCYASSRRLSVSAYEKKVVEMDQKHLNLSFTNKVEAK